MYGSLVSTYSCKERPREESKKAYRYRRGDDTRHASEGKCEETHLLISSSM